MNESTSGTMPTGLFDDWEGAILWAGAMKANYGMKFTVRRNGHGKWIAFIPRKQGTKGTGTKAL